MSNKVTSLKKSHTQTPDVMSVVEDLGKGFAARASHADETDSFVAENFELLHSSGLVEAAVPVALGGGGADITQLSDMLRNMAHYCSSTALAFAMHTHQVAIPAWRWSHQKVLAVEPLLKRVASEKIILLSSGGADWVAGSGTATKVDGGYKISARKIFASASPAGDLLMTMAVCKEEAQVLHFAVPMSSPHVRIEPTWKTMGMRGTASHDIIIDGHVVPDAAVALKRTPGAWHPVFHVIATTAIPLIYSVYVGVAEAARDRALHLAGKRRPSPHLTQAVGLLENEILGARLALRHMLDVVDRNAPSAVTVNDVMQGRALVVTHVLRSVDIALDVAGGAAFYRDNGLEKLFRDAQGARYHPMQAGPQSDYAGAMALGQSVEHLF